MFFDLISSDVCQNCFLCLKVEWDIRLQLTWRFYMFDFNFIFFPYYYCFYVLKKSIRMLRKKFVFSHLHVWTGGKLGAEHMFLFQQNLPMNHHAGSISLKVSAMWVCAGSGRWPLRNWTHWRENPQWEELTTLVLWKDKHMNFYWVIPD